MKLRTLDLFSGIGGFSLGLESTGFFETIGFVEKDKFCQKVLKKHWSNINIEEDIRNVKGEKYQADVVTGGFPCQPFSVAGKRKSTADDRYLWDEMLRVIRETKPRWVIGENVEGIVNINEGMVLRQVLNDLENEGFKSQCIIIPASGIGAWHQRKRIWILGYSEHNGYSSTKIKRRNDKTNDNSEKRKNQTSELERTSGPTNNGNVRMDVPNTNTGFSIRENEEIQSRGNAITNGSEDVSNANSWLRGGRGTELKSGDDREGWFYTEKEKQTREHIRCKTIGCNAVLGEDVPNASVKGLQGCWIQHNLEGEQRSEEFTTKTSSQRQQTWWETQSELCGVPNGVSYELDKDRSNRIRALGNSIVPQIARQIGLSIMEAELNGKI
jgi:DNA (cytosine-5)-methyltransferase 1